MADESITFYVIEFPNAPNVKFMIEREGLCRLTNEEAIEEVQFMLSVGKQIEANWAAMLSARQQRTNA